VIPLNDRRGEVWCFKWKHFPEDDVLLTLRCDRRLGSSLRCLNLETGEVSYWPLDMFASELDMGAQAVRRRIA
jgi:hypothetical protein